MPPTDTAGNGRPSSGAWVGIALILAAAVAAALTDRRNPARKRAA
jgi:hypothetical protein